jgi:hypothetical protein
VFQKSLRRFATVLNVVVVIVSEAITTTITTILLFLLLFQRTHIIDNIKMFLF